MALSTKQMHEATEIISKNKFKEGDFSCKYKEIEEVLQYYQITRHDAEN